MDYFQGVVAEFLRANRGVFINPECLIQLDTDTTRKGRHWYCDVMAVSFPERRAFLCEVTYSRSLDALIKRLQAWEQNWAEIGDAVRRDASLPADWQVQAWVFIPNACRDAYKSKLSAFLPNDGKMPRPRVTLLEKVVPWAYPAERKEDYLESMES